MSAENWFIGAVCATAGFVALVVVSEHRDAELRMADRAYRIAASKIAGKRVDSLDEARQIVWASECGSGDQDACIKAFGKAIAP